MRENAIFYLKRKSFFVFFFFNIRSKDISEIVSGKIWILFHRGTILSQVRVLSRIYRLWENSRVAEGHELPRMVFGYAPPETFLRRICAKMQSSAF